MNDAWALLIFGSLGVLAAFVERRLVELQARHDAELSALRERVAVLELHVRAGGWS